jgi:hypothetical protein
MGRGTRKCQCHADFHSSLPFSSATPCYNAQMTDKPTPTSPRQPLRLPPNCRDVTAEKIGTVIGIIGATAAAKATKPG